MAAAKDQAERFAAFNVDTPMGKFAVFVKLEAAMSAAMAREDAINAVRGDFYGAHGLSLRGEPREIAALPGEAFATKSAAGWAWLQRGYLPELEAAQEGAPHPGFQPTPAQLIDSITTLLEEANTVWSLLPESDRALINVLGGAEGRSLGGCLSDGLKAAKSATGRLAIEPGISNLLDL